MALLGLSCKLYRNSATFATPTWVEIDEVQDVTVGLDKNEGVIKKRGSGYELNLPGQKTTAINFGFLHDDTTNTTSNFDVLRDAYFDDDIIDFLAIDGASGTSGSTGFRAECFVKNFSENEPLEDGVNHDVELKPAPTANAQPVQFTVP